MLLVVLFCVFMVLALTNTPLSPEPYRRFGGLFLWLAVLVWALHTGLRF